MVSKLVAGPALIALVFLLNQCATASIIAPSPTSLPPTATATIATSQDATPKNAEPVSDGKSLLAETVRQLNQAESYQFSVNATLTTTLKGKPREWHFSGSGAAKPGSVRWALQGQADSVFNLVSVGGQIYCTDTRGVIKGCSLASGGPKPGASPYTVIAYLQNFEQTGEVATRSIQGKDYYYLTFSPSLSKVAALDAGHAKALADVTAVNGEVWIDQSTKLPYQEKATVNYRPGAVQESVETTITFEKYNQQVEIKLPR